jgi:hypothetical protein
LPTFCICLGDHLAYLHLAVRGNRTNLCGLGRRGDLLAALLQFVDQCYDRLVDTALEVHRIHAGGDRLGAVIEGKNGRLK